MTKLLLFPLENILLPGGLMPLQIFEERYIHLIQDCVGRSSIGIIQPLDKESSEDSPPLHAMGCSGRIIRFDEMNDGKFYVILRGEHRFHYIEDKLTPRGYREAEIRWIIEPSKLDTDEKVIDDRVKFMESLAEYLNQMGVKADFSEIEAASDVQLINTLSMLLPAPQQEKQTLLEANSTPERLQILERMMHNENPLPASKKWQH